MGQLLCFLMMAGGLSLVIGFRLYEKKYGAPVENFVIPSEEDRKEKKTLLSLLKRKK